MAIVKALIESGKVQTTHSAVSGAAQMGLGVPDILAVVMPLKPTDFYKSMTTHADHTVWQDVYHTNTQVSDVYLKLSVIKEVLIVSFKEL